MRKLIQELFGLMFLEGYQRYKIKRYTRIFRDYFQRIMKGFSDSDTYSLDVTITKFVLPRLKRFKELHCGFPNGFTMETWDETIDKMINAFEIHDRIFDIITGIHQFLPPLKRVGGIGD